MPSMLRFAALGAALATLAACGGNNETQTGDTATAAAAASPPTPAASAADPNAMIDPNTATREQLMTVPGVDAALADSIVATRPHANMLAVDKVLATKLSEPQRDSVYARLWSPIDLNKATKEEIELIPGVGAKMRHEFEEYRPYRDLARFRREIGKYVDSTEVARLERYVKIQ